MTFELVSVQDKEYEVLSFASQKHFTSKLSSSEVKKGFIMPDAAAYVFKAVSHRVHQKRLRWYKGFDPHRVHKPGGPAGTCLCHQTLGSLQDFLSSAGTGLSRSSSTARTGTWG